ncbi:TonB-dependent receptor [Sorangium cellulosum]|uniref:TonB-dependent receptor n=1 Tax=Sorangium cellulosum TaxID=56 RepID=A0A2L0EKP2_SORCE|nr:TonB-dependent receptor [Sorangium cellulosum]
MPRGTITKGHGHRPPLALLAALSTTLAAARPARAEGEDPGGGALEVTVEAEKPGSEAASRVSVGHRELELRPRLRPGDIIEAVPGLFAVQHAGGGKANQYFLRGFDADHGTDVAFFADGVPVNLVSHGHGHGFTDLYFLIPELVTGLDGYKGPYYANIGDFGTAGAVNLRFAEKLDESHAQLSVGQHGIRRGLAIASPELGDDLRAVVAAELYGNDGPFVSPERLRRLNVYLKATHDVGRAGKVQATWMSYASTWNGSGQIPARAVCGEGEQGALNPPPSTFGQPCLDRFGSVDPTEGGATERHAASLAYTTAWDDAELSALAYLVRYRFTLYSNFTFFSEDPVRGDQIEQNDDRVVGGADFRFRKRYVHRGARFTTSVGAQVRADDIEKSLHHDAARERLEERSRAHVSEGQIGVYVEQDARLLRWLRFVVGARGQWIDVNVDDLREDLGATGNRSSGVRGEMQIFPKFTAVVSPTDGLDLFAHLGRGFHSNDAQGVVLGDGAATLITPATGYEVGARVAPLRGLTLSAAGFLLDLDSELVWSGDAGETEASGPTRRYGVEIGGRYRLGSWLFADVDATFTRARFRANAGNGSAVALAPTRTLTAGVSARPTFGAYTPFAAVRVKAIGARPATEDEALTAEGFTVVDANAGLRFHDVEVAVDVQNLFNTRWREVQFASESRLPYEPAAVTGIHYSPGWPFTAIARATLYWK